MRTCCLEDTSETRPLSPPPPAPCEVFRLAKLESGEVGKKFGKK